MIALRRSTVLADVHASSSTLVHTGAAPMPTAAAVPPSTTPVSVAVECANVPLRWTLLVGLILIVLAGGIVLAVGSGVYLYLRYT